MANRIVAAWAALMGKTPSPDSGDATAEVFEPGDDVAEEIISRARPRGLIWAWHHTPKWPLVVGSFAVLASVCAEYIWLLVDGQGKVDFGSISSVIINMEVPIKLISELGFAFIIAWIVAMTIEWRFRVEAQAEIARERRAITDDVFRAIYQIRHSKTYVAAFIERVLESTLIRTNYYVSYRIDPFPAEEARECGIDKDRFVLLTLRSRYDARSASTSKKPYSIKFGVPARGGKLAQLSKVTSCIVDGQRQDAKEVDMGDPSNRFYELFAGDLNPSQSKSIEIDAKIVKELSDSEMFGFLDPTMGMRIRVEVNVPNLRFGVRARTVSPIREYQKQDDHSGEWIIDGPIAPYNSVVLWWRTPEDDGAPDTVVGGEDTVR